MAVMALFAVVYHFTCPACMHLNVGKVLFESDDKEMASHNVLQRLQCELCRPLSDTFAVAATLVFPATREEIEEHQRTKSK